MKVLFIIFLSITSFLTYSQDSLKITFYNLLNFPSSQQDRADTLKKIIDYIKPDIFVVNELTSFNGGALIKNKSIIEFGINNPKLRPVSASADSREVKNVTKVKVYQRNDVNLRIMYDQSNSMEDRYLREQFAIG